MGVDPLSYFSFQPVLHDWDGAYKRTLAAVSGTWFNTGNSETKEGRKCFI